MRYDQGPPYERISDEEATNRYEEVAPHLSEEDYRLSAQEAFEWMSPKEREEFGRMLQEQTRQEGHGSVPGAAAEEEDLGNPDFLAQLMSRMHQQQPDAVGSLMKGMLGSGGGGLVGGMLGSGMTGGRRSLRRRWHDEQPGGQGGLGRDIRHGRQEVHGRPVGSELRLLLRAAYGADVGDSWQGTNLQNAVTVGKFKLLEHRRRDGWLGSRAYATANRRVPKATALR